MQHSSDHYICYALPVSARAVRCVFMILTPRLGFLVQRRAPLFRAATKYTHTQREGAFVCVCSPLRIAMLILRVCGRRKYSYNESRNGKQHIAQSTWDVKSLWTGLSVLLTIHWIWCTAAAAIIRGSGSALIWCAKLARRQLWQRLDGDTRSIYEYTHKLAKCYALVGWRVAPPDDVWVQCAMILRVLIYF